MNLARPLTILTLGSVLLPACTQDPPPAATEVRHVSMPEVASSVRRLSRQELRTTLQDLLGTDPGADIELLPADSGSSFDTEAAGQAPSAALVEGLKLVGKRAAERLVADPVRLNALLGCTKRDTACLRSFVGTFGRRVLRRPLAEDEVERYVALAEKPGAQGQFEAGVLLVVRALLLAPEFAYLIETGKPVANHPDIVELTACELAARLAYLLWGSTPDDALLDAAAQGLLDTSAGLEHEAQRLLDSPAAHRRVVDFHAQWLGYRQSALPSDLAAAMQRETNVLVERTAFDPTRSWYDLFLARDTYVDDSLAAHYDLANDGKSGPRWHPYAGTERQGILSHATFLSVRSKFGDTSPTQRGLLVRTKLLCQAVNPAPPDVNVDTPPVAAGPSICKRDRYEAHAHGKCANCHAPLDPVGFGLENYDQTGAFRVHDPGAPDCPISGQGELTELGTFRGPAQLADRLVQSGQLDACVVEQFYRFAVGRAKTPADQPHLDALLQAFRRDDHRFRTLLMEFVTSPTFRRRAVQ
jgi:hypothetical protein